VNVAQVKGFVLSRGRCSDRVGDVVVALADTLITTDFSVLTLTLLHECLKLSIITLGNGLGLHLDTEAASSSLDALADIENCLLKAFDTDVLVETCAGQDVKWGRNQLDLDLGFLGVASLSSAESSLDGIDTFVAEAGDLDVGTDLGGLRCETFADIELELVGDRGGRECDVIPDLGVSALWVRYELQTLSKRGGTNVMESLKASMAWPYFLLSGHAMLS
jgi:hypothetical protein